MYLRLRLSPIYCSVSSSPNNKLGVKFLPVKKILILVLKPDAPRETLNGGFTVPNLVPLCRILSIVSGVIWYAQPAGSSLR
jgi:hypothetical protein